MSKKAFKELREKLEDLCGTDWLDTVSCADGKFSVNLNFIKSDKGTSFYIKTPNGTEAVEGFSFAAIAKEFGFDKLGTDFVFTGAPEPKQTATDMAKAHKRAELQAMAKEAGLDGDTYTNKTELAKAILATE